MQEKLQKLSARAQKLEMRLFDLDRRIVRLQSKQRPILYQPRVHPELCRRCGICENRCPAGAIAIDTVARIDPKRCIGCGICADICPVGAITCPPLPASAILGAAAAANKNRE